MEKYGYREFRYLHPNDLISFLSDENWYDLGTFDDVHRLSSSLIGRNISVDLLVEVATDIVEHSSLLSADDITCVMFGVCRLTYSIFFES